jgi:hypothetical protein
MRTIVTVSVAHDRRFARFFNVHSTARTNRLKQLSARIRGIPDQLALVQLDLKECRVRDGQHIPAPVQDAITDACTQLHRTLVEITEIVRYVDGLDNATDGAKKPLPPSASKRSARRAGGRGDSSADAGKYSGKRRAA